MTGRPPPKKRPVGGEAQRAKDKSDIVSEPPSNGELESEEEYKRCKRLERSERSESSLHEQPSTTTPTTPTASTTRSCPVNRKVGKLLTVL